MTPDRVPLNRERVLHAAVALADELGIDGFSMRRLAKELGVVPMALYKHFASKDELLDGMIDAVFARLEAPSPDSDWKPALKARALSVRRALARHPWAIGLMEIRRPGPANLEHHEATMRCLRQAGFPFALAIHAYSVQDAYVYGFAQQERALNFETPQSAGEAARRRAEEIGGLDQYPYLAEIAEKLPETGYDPAVEFEWGLDLILDGLERRLDAQNGRAG
ncbi:TetR/AcrR family transcriptional regulator C-terminal domain-containing protein [Paraconexibacter sp.]|uniref:TetR/AcrR family transcriptional regulator C-terminal domain-containing protein n=1 Tax=Paraconexibacter sp. TaxID=2949640 RepID=UPI0035689130